MKTIFTCLLSIFLVTSILSAEAARVTVSFYGNQDYQVFIDGKSVYSGSRKTYLNNVQPGRHTIAVYRWNKNNRRSNRPVYSSNFVVRPQYDMNIIINQDGYVRFDEDRVYDNRRYDKDNRDRDDRDNRYENDRYDKNRDWDNDRTRDRNYGYGNNRGWDNDYDRAISDAQFNQLVQKIRNQWFNKLSAAREAVNDYYFTTRQVRELLIIFNTENDRLDVAKLAYRKTVDQRNYSGLYDLFSGRAQNELNQYIRDNRY